MEGFEVLICVMLQDIVLDFSPGPIYAVDGDSGLSTPLSYAILSGNTHTDQILYLKSIVLPFVHLKPGLCAR